MARGLRAGSAVVHGAAGDVVSVLLALSAEDLLQAVVPLPVVAAPKNPSDSEPRPEGAVAPHERTLTATPLLQPRVSEHLQKLPLRAHVDRLGDEPAVAVIQETLGNSFDPERL